MADQATFEFGVEVRPGLRANTVGPSVNIEAMYPGAGHDGIEVLRSGLVVDVLGNRMDFGNSTVWTLPMEDRAAILGVTVSRACGISANCKGSCPMAQAGRSAQEMYQANCARGNTVKYFEEMGAAPQARFLMTAVGKDVFVVGSDDRMIEERTGDDLLFHKLPNAVAVVFRESWLREQGLTEFATAMNGADGSFGMATTKIRGERVFIGFCSMRDNMGDRSEDEQIIRKGIDALFDVLDLTPEERRAEAENMEIAITLGASASLKNFAHMVQVPTSGPLFEEIMLEEAALVAQTRDQTVTSAIFLDYNWRGALKRGNIFPELEAKSGMVSREMAFTPDRCPGDGQSCHVDYRAETWYAIEKQLVELGLKAENIHWDDSHALDPADVENNMASNRLEQNNGLNTPELRAKTNRTLNGSVFYL